jgi:hypothetical protein
MIAIESELGFGTPRNEPAISYATAATIRVLPTRKGRVGPYLVVRLKQT